MMHTRVARKASRTQIEELDAAQIALSRQIRAESAAEAPLLRNSPSYNFNDISVLAPQPAVARDTDESEKGVGSFLSDAASGAGGLLSDAASGVGNMVKSDVSGVKTLAGVGSLVGDSLADPLVNGIQGIDKGVDWVEKNNTDQNKKMVDQTKDIPILGGLAQGLATVSNVADDTIGGTIKGVGDLATGTVNGIAHPLDFAGSVEGIMEHDSTLPGMGTLLKGGHAAYDMVENGGGQYGNSMGDVANHLLNPLQQEKDDAKYNTGLATSIVAPEGWQKWKDNPVDAMARAATNIGPIVGGIAEGAGGKGLGEGGPREVIPEGTTPGDPTPAGPTEEENLQKQKLKKMGKTGAFDRATFDDWYENKRPLGIPYDPTPVSPNQMADEWAKPAAPDLPGSHNPVFDQTDPAAQPDKQRSPLATTGDGTTVPGQTTQPGLQPFSPGDTKPGMDPWGDNPWEKTIK